MRIAVTYADGMIFQHFGHTQQFKVYEVENGAIVSSEVVDTNGSGHGGGDDGIMEDFTAGFTGTAESRSSISRSVESHLMACAIEQARLTGQVVDMEEYRRTLK